jgi:hypothetical protein
MAVADVGTAIPSPLDRLHPGNLATCFSRASLTVFGLLIKPPEFLIVGDRVRVRSSASVLSRTRSSPNPPEPKDERHDHDNP